MTTKRTSKRLFRALAAALALALVAAACGDDDGDVEPASTTAAAPAPTEAPEAPADPEPADPEPAEPEPAESEPAEPEPAEPEPAAPMDLDVDAILAADLADCGPAPQGEPLRIGYAADFSDLGGFVDIPAAKAAEYFVELLNCWGGVDGHPVEMVIRDIEGDPETAGRVAQELLDENVTAILGPAFFDVNQAILQGHRRSGADHLGVVHRAVAGRPRAVVAAGLVHRHRPGRGGRAVRHRAGLDDRGHLQRPGALLRLRRGGLH